VFSVLDRVPSAGMRLAFEQVGAEMRGGGRAEST